MLLNVSYNNPDIKRRIDAELGPTIPFFERIKMGGIGSPRLVITSTSVEINNLLILDNNRNYCNVEIRPKGIIVGFRSLLESYALVIPFYKLRLYKGRAEEYSIYRDHYFIKVEAKEKNVHSFFKKLLAFQAENAPMQVDDL
ncbi:hypothetical protein ACFQ1M_00840 [Sungkyunkwania multivorans]|uniref:Arginyl-tRNA synthetase n=1 Tax=Sungkyunkwania multivorans TaxID=1173618 RepID=A0ABW3CSI7_9FLAO